MGVRAGGKRGMGACKRQTGKVLEGKEKGRKKKTDEGHPEFLL